VAADGVSVRATIPKAPAPNRAPVASAPCLPVPPVTVKLELPALADLAPGADVLLDLTDLRRR